MSMGAQWAGVRVAVAIEADKYAAETFSHNHPDTHVICDDVRKITHIDTPVRDEQLVLFGGPPCQGFSTSNQKTRDAENENNWLFREYLRFVDEVKPDWVVFENVKGLLDTENGFFLDAVLAGFKKDGYTTSHFILNSADYGVPQTRNRLFIVASLHGVEISEPDKFVTKHVTVAQALKDLPYLENGAFVDEKAYMVPARTSYAKFLRARLKKCHNNLVTANSQNIIERYSYIPQGGNWENIPKNLMKNYADVSRCHTGIYHRLKENEPSIVIGNYRKNMLVHPWQDRGLSVREAARLQSFPDEFRFTGSIGFQQQQVGNAVPPLLAKAVFSQIINR